ncbi:MAG: thioredoxin domain-containing protein [Planctomycetota bacterium]
MSEPLILVCPSCGNRSRLPRERLGDGPLCGTCNEPLLGPDPIELDGPRFLPYVSGSGLPVVVDFWAPWCRPCLAMAPEFAKAAAELQGEAVLAKLDVEQHQGIAEALTISGIPTIAIFEGGREVARTSGAMPSHQLVKWIRQSLRVTT